MESFNQEQMAFIRQVAQEIIPMALENHVNACPHGQKVNKTLWISVGVALGAGVFWGLSLPALASMVLAKLGLS